jgi:hypothetical protein
MENRYSLRFDIGERTGETIPIPASGFTIGRKPGNSLQILDNSVSGNHAAIELDGSGARVRDLGSTNGTRVGDQRVQESRLAHGDHVTFGNVRMTFLDAQMSTPALGVAPVSVSSSAAAATSASVPSSGTVSSASLASSGSSVSKTVFTAPAEGLLRVSADVLARSNKRSRLGLVVVVLALAGGGVWFYLNRSSGSTGVVIRPVQPVAGDLFADEYSFEGEHDSWSAAEGSPVAFLKSERARYSGSFGLGVDLGAKDWALHRSKEVRCDADRELEARAMLRAGEDIEIRLGIEFSAPATGDAAPPGPITAWSRAVRGGSGFEAAQLTVPVPPGYTFARVCVLARPASASSQGGSAAFDDASLVARAAPSKPLAQVNEHRLYAFGDPTSTAMLFKVDRVLISNLEARKDDSAGDPALLDLAFAGDAAKIGVSASDAIPTGGSWSLRAEAPLAHSRIATIAAGAYATHGAAFDRDSVQTLLLGSGNDLVALKFSSPVRVTGVADGAASRIAIKAAGQKSFDLQLDFKAEKKEAGTLAYNARGAEKKGDLGQCLKLWNELLNTYPYEETLVAEAESTRGRLIQKGLEELRGLRLEIERARFFRLVDLYRQCRDKALKVGERYAASEVEGEAKTVAAEVDVDLKSLEADLSKSERARLTMIMNTLVAQKADGLAGELKSYLDSHFEEKK